MKRRLGLKGKFLVLFAVFTPLVLAALSFFTYVNYRQSVINRYKIEGTRMVRFASEFTNFEDMANFFEATNQKQFLLPDSSFENVSQKKEYVLDYYLDSGQKSRYASLEDWLIKYKATMGVEHIYAFVPLENDKATYIFDIYSDEELKSLSFDDVGCLGWIEDLNSSAFKESREIFDSGEQFGDNIEITQSDYGYLASCYWPVLNPDGSTYAIFGIDIPMDEILNYLQGYAIIMIVTVGGLIIICFGIILFIIQRYLVLPILLLKNKAIAYAASDHTEDLSNYYVEIRGRNELSDLADTFNNMMQQIDDYILSIERITAERHRMKAELDITAQIQKSMLPGVFPAFPERREFDIFASIQQAREMGGSFYDFFFVDDRNLVVVTGEVSGKGIPAALLMVMTMTMIKNYARLGYSPEKICLATNNMISQNNEAAGITISAFLGIIDVHSGKFTYVNAGHSKPLIKESGSGFEFINAIEYFALGDMKDVQYKNQTMLLNQGDMLFLYTAGLPNAENSRGDLYSAEFMQDDLNSIIKEVYELPDIDRELAFRLLSFKGETELKKDITTLFFRFFGS